MNVHRTKTLLGQISTLSIISSSISLYLSSILQLSERLMPNATVQLSAFTLLLSYSAGTILKSIYNHCMSLSSPSSNPSPPIHLLTPENKKPKHASTDEKNSKPKDWTQQSCASSSNVTQLQSPAFMLDSSEQSRELNYFHHRAIYSIIHNTENISFFLHGSCNA